MDPDSKRCYCCLAQPKYPDYLAQLRRERLEKLQKKQLSEALMESPVPMIESRHLHDEIVT